MNESPNSGRPPEAMQALETLWTKRIQQATLTSPSMTEERSIGRPAIITDEVGEAIFQRIEAGESISAITKKEGFPSSRTLYKKVESDEEFRSRFNWSLMVRSEMWAEEIVSISDSVKGSSSMEEINAAKLAVNARQWIVSRLLAKKYGDKTADINVSAITNNFLTVSEERQKEIQERTRRLLGGEDSPYSTDSPNET